jgi:hypothetical protein
VARAPGCHCSEPPDPPVGIQARRRRSETPPANAAGPAGLDRGLELRASARCCASVDFGPGAEVPPAGSARDQPPYSSPAIPPAAPYPLRLRGGGVRPAPKWAAQTVARAGGRSGRPACLLTARCGGPSPFRRGPYSCGMTNRVAVAVPLPDWTTWPVGSTTSNLNGADRAFFLVKVATARTTTWPPGPAGVKMKV